MKITLEVDHDQLTDCMVSELKTAYVDQKTCWKHEEYSKKLAKALLKVIEYYSIPNEYKEWFETVKDL